MNPARHLDEALRSRGSLIQELGLDNYLLEQVLQEYAETSLTDAVLRGLEKAAVSANEALGSQSKRYIDALEVTLDGVVSILPEANDLEYGSSPRQMLEGLLAAKKSKIAKDGSVYNTIPIGAKPAVDVKSTLKLKASEVLSRGRPSDEGKRTLENMVSDVKNFAAQRPKAFVTASSKQNSATTWVHPGFAGMNQLDHINDYIYRSTVSDLEAAIDRLLEPMR